ncbi:tRNA pseudouridine(38-40) synthase TruA [soil metagenome]
MPAIRLLIEYDGGAYSGWQVQPKRTTIQGELERALAIVVREPVNVVGSGRTDAGVHARGQVAHFSRARELDPYRLKASLNGLLPDSIRILGAAHAPDDFHARYGARRRLYRYHVSTEPRALDRGFRLPVFPAPDFELMNEAAQHLIGQHDFDALCIIKSETQNRVCHVQTARWLPEERPGDWYFEMAADRFLHGMVRAAVGTLLEIGRGKYPAAEIVDIIASRDRRRAGPGAPPPGLVLHEVGYEHPLKWQ